MNLFSFPFFYYILMIKIIYLFIFINFLSSILNSIFNKIKLFDKVNY
mgnify:CR=1 FL=1